MAARWTEQWAVVGVPGSGKSHAAHALVEEMANVREERDDIFVDMTYDYRVWVYDPTQQWRHDRTIGGYPLRPFEERDEYPFVYFDDEEIEEACEDAQDTEGAGLIVVFDECLTIEQIDFKAIKKLCTIRRHRGVDLIFCTQRPRCIPVPILAMCTQVLMFRLHYPEDLKHLQNIVQSEDLEIVPRLGMPDPSTNTPPGSLHKDLSGRAQEQI